MTAPVSLVDVAAEPMLPAAYRVVARREETADTVSLDLAPQSGDGIRFNPGQFTMVYAFGIGEAPISIAGGAADGSLLTHTVRTVGAVTRAICHLQVGDDVGIRGPYGRGWPLESAAGKDVVIAAGGIGLAPLRAVVHHLIQHRPDFGAVSVIYGARTPADILYADEIHEWRARFDMEVEVTVDRSTTGWYGDVGLVTNLLPRITFDPERTVAMVCGPEIMMKVVARELGAGRVAMDDIYVSLERNMKCAIGFCGHCQYGPDFVCRDGPCTPYARIHNRLRVDEL